MSSQQMSVPLEQEFDPGFYIGCAASIFVLPGALRSWRHRVLHRRQHASASLSVDGHHPCESQQILTGLAQSTVTANAAERVQIISQRLLTRDNLLESRNSASIPAKLSRPPMSSTKCALPHRSISLTSASDVTAPIVRNQLASGFRFNMSIHQSPRKLPMNSWPQSSNRIFRSRSIAPPRPANSSSN